MDTQNPIIYCSLEQILLRKEQLRVAINKDNTAFSKKWKSLFAKPQNRSKKAFNLSSFMSVGASAADGFILAWKLYKKFHKR